jgi:hypothetical protein
MDNHLTPTNRSSLSTDRTQNSFSEIPKFQNPNMEENTLHMKRDIEMGVYGIGNGANNLNNTPASMDKSLNSGYTRSKKSDDLWLPVDVGY